METLGLLWGTLLLRPYVFVFLGVAVLCAAAEQGLARALRFAGIVWGVAFLAEFASTRIGVPFGYYEYTGATRGQELYLSNVPVMDTLSFIFLAYGAASLARLYRAPRGTGLRAWRDEVPALFPERGAGGAVLLGAILFMLADVVIDPVALQGERWFLGQIYRYPGGGLYFGVPLANFAGWFLVGLVALGLNAWCDRRAGGPAAPDWARAWPYRALYGPALLGLILAFNVAVTAGIGAWRLLGVSSAIAGALVFVAASRLWIVPSCARARLAEPAVGQPGWEVRR
jgi:putative membrane protein